MYAFIASRMEDGKPYRERFSSDLGMQNTLTGNELRSERHTNSHAFSGNNIVEEQSEKRDY